VCRREAKLTPVEDVAVADGPGAAVRVRVPAHTAWIQLKGWSNGTYDVRCDPAPRNASAGSFTGFVGEGPGTLYVAELDPDTRYSVELVHRSGRTAVYGLTGVVWIANRQAFRLGLGLGLGLVRCGVGGLTAGYPDCACPCVLPVAEVRGVWCG
jgi:hypothetical protein